jgi:hypothetical protein
MRRYSDRLEISAEKTIIQTATKKTRDQKGSRAFVVLVHERGRIDHEMVGRLLGG